MLKVLIVDDELRARRSLERLISDYCETAAVVVGVAASVPEAAERIRALRPDVVLLDVSMPGRNGFALAERAEFADVGFVFVTAHPDYALRAFKVEAVDYLLKPVDPARLREALQRAGRRLRRDAGAVERLVVYAAGERRVIPHPEIAYLEADGAYTRIITREEVLLVSRRIGEVGESLLERGFFRTNRSYLVNLRNVLAVGPASEPYVRMSFGREVPLSRRKRGAFIEALALVAR